MRKIEMHKVGAAEVDVFAVDERGPGGANHHYQLIIPHPETTREDATLSEKLGVKEVTNITFQKGPIHEAGMNGVTSEALLAVLIDRHLGFADGPYPSRGNAVALTKLEEALMWLQKRTRDRMARGVEGTMQK